MRKLALLLLLVVFAVVLAKLRPFGFVDGRL